MLARVGRMQRQPTPAPVVQHCRRSSAQRAGTGAAVEAAAHPECAHLRTAWPAGPGLHAAPPSAALPRPGGSGWRGLGPATDRCWSAPRCGQPAGGPLIPLPRGSGGSAAQRWRAPRCAQQAESLVVAVGLAPLQPGSGWRAGQCWAVPCCGQRADGPLVTLQPGSGWRAGRHRAVSR